MEDKFEPEALKCAGKWPCQVKNRNADFTYQADIEKVGDDLTTNNKICNGDSNDLTVSWEKGGLGTSPLNGLPEGCCLDNPHLIAGYDGIDHDAPILYTQSKRNRDASVYEVKAPEGDNAKTLDSIIRTAYRVNELAKEIFIHVRATIYPDDRIIKFDIKRSSPGLDIALGSMWRMSSNKSLLRMTEEMTSAPIMRKEGAEVRFQPVSKALRRKDLDWLPKSMTDDALVVFHFGKSRRRHIGFSLPLEKGSVGKYGIRTGALMVLDDSGNLISIGRYSFFGPN